MDDFRKGLSDLNATDDEVLEADIRREMEEQKESPKDTKNDADDGLDDMENFKTHDVPTKKTKDEDAPVL